MKHAGCPQVLGGKSRHKDAGGTSGEKNASARSATLPFLDLPLPFHCLVTAGENEIQFAFFIECFHILEPALSAAECDAVESMTSLLAAVEANNVYRATAAESSAESEEVVPARLKALQKIATALMKVMQAATEATPAEGSDASRVRESCSHSVCAFTRLNHKIAEPILGDLWKVFDHWRDQPSAEMLHCLFLKYHKINQLGNLFATMFDAIRSGHLCSETFVILEIDSEFADLVSTLPTGQVARLCTCFQGELSFNYEDTMAESSASATHPSNFEKLVSLLTSLLYAAPVDESTALQLFESLQEMCREVVAPCLQQCAPKTNWNPLVIQAALHLYSAAVSLHRRMCKSRLLPSDCLGDKRYSAYLGIECHVKSVLAVSNELACDSTLKLALAECSLECLAAEHSIESAQADAEVDQSLVTTCVLFLWHDLQEVISVCTQNAGTIEPYFCWKWRMLVANVSLLQHFSSKEQLAAFVKVMMKLVSLPHQHEIIRFNPNWFIEIEADLYEIDCFYEMGIPAVAELLSHLLRQNFKKQGCDHALDALTSVCDSSWGEENDAWLEHGDCSSADKAKSKPVDAQALDGIVNLLQLLARFPTAFFMRGDALFSLRFLSTVHVLLHHVGSKQRTVPDNLKRAIFACRALLVEITVCILKSTTTEGKSYESVLPLVHGAIEKTLAGPPMSVLGGSDEADYLAWAAESHSCLQPLMSCIIDSQLDTNVDSSALDTTLTAVFKSIAGKAGRFPAGHDVKSCVSLSWDVACLNVYLREAAGFAESETREMAARSLATKLRTVATCSTILKDLIPKMLQAPDSSWLLTSEVERASAGLHFAAIWSFSFLLDVCRLSEADENMFAVIQSPVTVCTKLLLLGRNSDSGANGGHGGHGGAVASARGACVRLLESLASWVATDATLAPQQFGDFFKFLLSIHSAASQWDSQRVEGAAGIVRATRTLAAGSSPVQLSTILCTVAVEIDHITTDTAAETHPVRGQVSLSALQLLIDILVTRDEPSQSLRPIADKLTESLSQALERLGESTLASSDGPSPLELMLVGVTNALATMVSHPIATTLHAEAVGRILQASGRARHSSCWTVAVSTAQLLLLQSLAKYRSLVIVNCMPLFIHSIKTVMKRLYTLLMESIHDAAAVESCINASLQLNHLFEMLRRHMTDGALRQYIPYLLSDYVGVVSKRQKKADSNTVATRAAVQLKFRAALKDGLHSLTALCAGGHEMRQLHTVLTPAGRVVMSTIVSEYRSNSRFKGN